MNVEHPPHTPPLPHQRNLILASLLVLAALAWTILVWQSVTTDTEMTGLTMGLAAPLFIAIWVVMMVAMMFPTAAPMILIFAQVYASKQARGQAFVPTWVFVSAYMVVWTLFGVLAYAAAAGAQTLAHYSSWLTDNAGRLGGGVLVLAGLYQLSPLKRSCLSKCRTPLNFILHAWRDGYRGAFRMGFEHGVYCLGCCWMLFVILFPLGVMNVAAMAVITLVVFAEKSLPISQRIVQLAAITLIVYGALSVFMPNLLPTMISGGTGM